MGLGTIIFILVAIGLLILLVSYLISKSKGKIKINLDKYEFNAGEKITGKIILKLKKPVKAKKLNVGLEGISVSKSHSRDGGTSTSSRPVFDFKKPLAGEGEYPVGEKIVDFELLIPKDIFTNKIGNKMADSLIKSVQILSGKTSNIKWYVKSDLEIPGFNIRKKVRVNIS